MKDTKNVVVVAWSEDAEEFKKIQSQYKSEGKSGAFLFKEIVQLLKNKNSKREVF